MYSVMVSWPSKKHCFQNPKGTGLGLGMGAGALLALGQGSCSTSLLLGQAPPEVFKGCDCENHCWDVLQTT